MMLWNTLQSSSIVCCTAHPNCDPLDQKKFLKWEPSLAYTQGLAAQKERFWGCLAISVEQKRAFTQAISKWKLIHFRYIMPTLHSSVTPWQRKLTKVSLPALQRMGKYILWANPHCNFFYMWRSTGKKEKPPACPMAGCWEPCTQQPSFPHLTNSAVSNPSCLSHIALQG